MPAREQVQKIQGFGLRLLNRLAALKMTQTTLAKRTGVSRQTLHRAIHHDELTGRVAKKIAGVVGTDLLTVDIGAPALALVRAETRVGEARQTSRTTAPAAEVNTIPSGAPDDAAEMAGRLSSLGEVLEILRRDEGSSQEGMADMVSISVATYRRVITGKARPKDAWLRAWGEVAGADDPDGMLSLKQFKRGDAFHQAVGRQLHAWRVSAGLDLIDVADACGESILTLARHEAGWEENFLALDDLAPLYGTSSELIFRAAALAAPRDDTNHRPPVERVLTFEAAQMHAYQQQEERDESRAYGGWDIMRSCDLFSTRVWSHYDREDVAKHLGVRVTMVDAWEDDKKEPTLRDFEHLSILYRRPPWELRYGDAWTRAISFPNTHESRSLIFGQIFPPELRAWMYRLLAEFASIGFDDIELMDVRETLTNPAHYDDIVAATSPEEAERFLWAAFAETATEMWRTIIQPDWVERPASAWKSLPPVFTPPNFDRAAAAQLRRDFRERSMRIAFERGRVAMAGGPTEDDGRGDGAATGAATGAAPRLEGAPAQTDVFAFYRTTPHNTLQPTDEVASREESNGAGSSRGAGNTEPRHL